MVESDPDGRSLLTFIVQLLEFDWGNLYRPSSDVAEKPDTIHDVTKKINYFRVLLD